tara:strand:+ start:1160 stop:1855 length:696 start_codon:yes stop_codon:yes gene_type:complete
MTKTVDVSGAKLPIEELHLTFITDKLRNDYGFLESSRSDVPVNNKNQIMPMYTYPCYEWLDSIDWTGSKVFEFGTGYSTVWWQNKKVDYYGVEDDGEWYQRIIKLINGKQLKVKYEIDLKKYMKTIYDYDFKFDVIVIDGQVRFDCIKPALEKIKDNGMIIFDNSDWHKSCKEELDKTDLIPIHFHGFKPIHVDSETTSCYIGRKFNKKANHIIPMGGTIREQHSTDKSIL